MPVPPPIEPSTDRSVAGRLAAVGRRSSWVVVAAAPVLMTWTLARGTGGPPTEKRMATFRRGYAEYVQRTSGFLPGPPRRRPVS